MAFRDLSSFLAALEARGDLKKITAQVSTELEAAEIADRAVKSGGPALLFTNVKDSSVPLVMNLFGTMERMCFALGVERLDDIAARVREIMEPEIPTNFLEKLKMLPRLARLAEFIPKTVSSGPCQEVVERERPSLSFLPVVKTWPGDGGPFITLPLVFTKDPETGRRNVRDVPDARLRRDDYGHALARPQGRGAALPRLPAEAGADARRGRAGRGPRDDLSASAPLPEDVDEMMFAGFLRREPVELVRCVTSDIEVPAHAEVILEGYVDPDELRTEGPFGDHTGYYSLADKYPVFHLTCVTRRRGARSIPPPSSASRRWRTSSWGRPPSGSSSRCSGRSCRRSWT